MALTIIVGLGLFIVFRLCFGLVMGRSSAQGALLEQVVRESRRGTGAVSGPWRPAVSADLVAKPFTAFRRFFSTAPDPEIVRRLMLAGYRKPYPADIFLGMRLPVPAVRGLLGVLEFAERIISIF